MTRLSEEMKTIVAEKLTSFDGFYEARTKEQSKAWECFSLAFCSAVAESAVIYDR